MGRMRIFQEQLRIPTSGLHHFQLSFHMVWGIESWWPWKVSLSSHIQWVLQYHGKWFRNHIHFMFQAFGVLQKRQVTSSTALQISWRDFIVHEEDIHALKLSNFLNATKEEARNVPSTNATIWDLCKHISAVQAKVMGTDKLWIRIGGQIWLTTAICGPLSLWITINPSDINDPIAQVFTSCNIKLDQFMSSNGPGWELRATSIALDPYGTSEFFHFIINTVIEELMGIRHTSLNQMEIDRKGGIFGWVSNYIGTVKVQGQECFIFILWSG